MESPPTMDVQPARCEPFCTTMLRDTGTRRIEPTAGYAAAHPVLAAAPTRSWIGLVITDVPCVRCAACGLRLYDTDVEGHLDRLVVAYWDDGAEAGGDLTVSCQPPAGAAWDTPPTG